MVWFLYNLVKETFRVGIEFLSEFYSISTSQKVYIYLLVDNILKK